MCNDACVLLYMKVLWNIQTNKEALLYNLYNLIYQL